MYHPTTRLLTVLELLQSHSEMSGADIARRLQVNVRTVRRYIVMLQDMGIPVESERGRYGTYALRPGFKLPPLMFNDAEVLALVLSLRVAQQTALSGAPFAVEGALAKIERVLPDSLRQQMEDIQQTMAVEVSAPSGIPADPHVIAVVGGAIRQNRQLQIRHTAFNGAITKRTIDPYGLAYRVGRWYAVGFCHLRQDIRTFRLDRVLEAVLLEESFQCPADFNTLEYVEQALAATLGIYRVEVLFRAPIEAVRQQIPAALGQLSEVEEGILMTCYVQSLPWFAGFLTGLTLPMTIHQPPELLQELHKLIERVQRLMGLAEADRI